MNKRKEEGEEMSTLIQCKNIKKTFGVKVALKDFSIEIESGKIIGLLGPNGSGKTTLIKTIAGLLQPNQGVVTVDGKEIGVESKKIVSYLPERTYFSTAIKIKDAIDFFEDFYEDFERKVALEMLERLDLDIHSKFKQLSKGNREKVQLVLVMSRKAKLFLLDEPIGGVDPASRDYILKTILTNYNEDASVIISTHLISDVEQVLDDIVFIKNGELVLQSTVDEIRQEHGKSVDALFREVFAC